MAAEATTEVPAAEMVVIPIVDPAVFMLAAIKKVN